jgi:DNA-binding response OmpR family regulator
VWVLTVEDHVKLADTVAAGLRREPDPHAHRRSGRSVPPTVVHGDRRLDPAYRTTTRAGRRLSLTRKEFSVLELLLSAGGRAVPAVTGSDETPAAPAYRPAARRTPLP